MNFTTIAEIYTANAATSDRLNEILAEINETDATHLPDGEKWSIAMIAEHISMVNHGMSRICAKMIDDAKQADRRSDGTLAITDKFKAYLVGSPTMKFEAPERVVPTGEVSLAESMSRLNASSDTFNAMQADFEAYDLSLETFPHPVFGPLTSVEWLVLLGVHEARHTRQIKDLLVKLRQ